MSAAVSPAMRRLRGGAPTPTSTAQRERAEAGGMSSITHTGLSLLSVPPSPVRSPHAKGSVPMLPAPRIDQRQLTYDQFGLPLATLATAIAFTRTMPTSNEQHFAITQSVAVHRKLPSALTLQTGQLISCHALSAGGGWGESSRREQWVGERS